MYKISQAYIVLVYGMPFITTFRRTLVHVIILTSVTNRYVLQMLRVKISIYYHFKLKSAPTII